MPTYSKVSNNVGICHAVVYLLNFFRRCRFLNTQNNIETGGVTVHDDLYTEKKEKEKVTGYVCCVRVAEHKKKVVKRIFLFSARTIP